MNASTQGERVASTPLTSVSVTGETSIPSSSRQIFNTALAVVLYLGTVTYLGILLASFHHVAQITLDHGLTIVYALVLALYAADNEACKKSPECARKKARPGEWFVLLWVVIGFYVFVVTSIWSNDYTAPDNFLYILGQVIALFGITHNQDFIKSWIQKWIPRER